MVIHETKPHAASHTTAQQRHGPSKYTFKIEVQFFGVENRHPSL